MRQIAALGMVVVVSALGACGFGNPSPVDLSFPNFALKNWQKFPADAVPRPIVRMMSNLHPETPGVFSSTAVETAFNCNTFTSSIGSLPSAVPAEAHATWVFGTTITYPAISAVEAAGVLESRPDPYSSPSCKNVAPMALTSARLGSSRFETDRGPADMTAWLFSMSGSTGELPFPAIAASAFWANGAGFLYARGQTEMSSDGMSLTWSFPGAAAQGRCGTDYKSTVAQTSTTIAVQPHQASTIPADCNNNFFGGAWRTIPVSLTQPLGGRVVVDEDGLPSAICPTPRPPVPHC